MPKNKPLEQYTSEELFQEVKTLREENKARRLASSRYDEVFSRVPEDLQRGLLKAIEVFAGDREKGAEIFRDFSNSVLEDRNDQSQVDEEGTMTDISNQGGDSNEELLQLVKDQQAKIEALEAAQKEQFDAAQQQQLAAAYEHLVQLGYKEGTEEWQNIIDLAGSEFFNGDIDRAHKVYDVFYPPAEGEGSEGEGEGEEGEGQQQSEEEGSEGEGDLKFPVTGSKGSSGGPRLDSSQGGEGELDLSKEAVEARAIAQLEALVASET